jgi:hypothetical protein
MYSVRLAAERGFGTGWVTYDEQFRLRKSPSPTSAWGDVDMELWLIYVATHEKPRLTVGQTFNNAYYDFQKEGPIMGTELKTAYFVPVGDSTGETVSLGEIAVCTQMHNLFCTPSTNKMQKVICQTTQGYTS